MQAGKILSWTALALELGYFDQAHFVRDFRQLVGMAPGEYEKSQSLLAHTTNARELHMRRTSVLYRGGNVQSQ